jgi:hypothetical protein
MSDDQVYDDCGTYAAYQRHVKEDTKIDEACRVAKNVYAQELRERNPGLRARERRDAAARGRALTRLAREHPDEYSRLLEDERAKASS